MAISMVDIQSDASLCDTIVPLQWWSLACHDDFYLQHEALNECSLSLYHKSVCNIIGYPDVSIFNAPENYVLNAGSMCFCLAG